MVIWESKFVRFNCISLFPCTSKVIGSKWDRSQGSPFACSRSVGGVRSSKTELEAWSGESISLARGATFWRGICSPSLSLYVTGQQVGFLQGIPLDLALQLPKVLWWGRVGEVLKVGGPWCSEALRWGLQSLAHEVGSWGCSALQDCSLAWRGKTWPLGASPLGPDPKGPGLSPH